MSILSVDNISPIGSGTSVTINSAATLVLNNANSTGIITAQQIVSNVGTFLSDVSVAGDFQVPDVIKHQGDVNTKIRFPANDTITAETAGSERIRITSDGKVGINQTSPAAMLQVDYDEGSSEVGLRLRAYNASGSKTWQLSEINGNAGVFTIRNATNGVNGLSIDGDGRFLKGLTSAAGSRSSTSVRYPHFQLSSPWSSGLGSYKIECTDDYPIIFIDSNASYASGSGAGVITWSVKDSSGDYCNTASVRSQIDSTPSNDSAPGRLQFMTTTSGTTPTTKMTIDSGGSVSKPLNPAFYAWLSTNNAVYSAGTIIPWDNTTIDTRSAFQTSGSDQGRFIVPTTGIYYFGWRLNRRDDSRFDLAIYQNGSLKYIDELRVQYNTATWQAESGHYLLSCTAGQKVDLRIFGVTNAGSGQFDGGGNGYYDAFFGWMIG